MSEKLSISQRTIGRWNSPRLGGAIGLCLHLQCRQRQKGVAVVIEKVDITVG